MLEYIILRILILSLIILVTLIDINYLDFISKLEIQLLLGTLAIIFILFIDPYTGLLLALLFLITYLRYYMKKYNISFYEKEYNKYPMNSLVTNEYITEQHLKDAQNNIVNNSNEYIGIKGVYGEPVYSSQGIDRIMPGFDKLNIYSKF